MIRTLIVDDQEMVRKFLRSVLGRYGISVVGEAGTVCEALQLIDFAAPNVVLLDIDLPDGMGFTVLKHIRTYHPGMAVVMHSGDNCPESVEQSRRLGAQAYVPKGTRPADLIHVLQGVRAGDEFW